MLPADSLGISRDSAFLFTEIDGSALGASFGRVSCIGKQNLLKNWFVKGHSRTFFKQLA